MELFTNTSRERFATIAENFVNHIFEDRGSGSIEDLVSAFVNAGFTKSEFFQVLDNYLLENYEWEEEPKETKTDEKVNPEVVSAGDSDQAILETALTQIGIPYSWAENPEGGCIFIEEVEDGKTTGKTVAEVYFTDEGEFNGLS